MEKAKETAQIPTQPAKRGPHGHMAQSVGR